MEINIPYKREYNIKGTGNIVDFIVDNKIVIELKAKRIIERQDYYQTQTYLQALGMRIALLVNFRNKYLKPVRVVRIEKSAKERLVG